MFGVISKHTIILNRKEFTMFKRITSVFIALFLVFVYTLPFVYAEEQILTSISATASSVHGTNFTGSIDFYKDKIAVVVSNSLASSVSNFGRHSITFTYKDQKFYLYDDRIGVNQKYEVDFYEAITALLKAHKADNSFDKVTIKEPSDSKFTYTIKSIMESCADKYIDELRSKYDKLLRLRSHNMYQKICTIGLRI